MTRLLACIVILLSSGCTHERFDSWASDRLGLDDGICKDGELELFPPRCEPNDVAKQTSNGEFAR